MVLCLFANVLTCEMERPTSCATNERANEI